MEIGQSQLDAEIAAGFHRGERWAFDAAARAYFVQITHYLSHLLQDRDRAVDLAQEAFFLACRAHQKLDPNRVLAPWLFQIARNLAYKELNYRKKHKNVPLEEAQENEPRALKSLSFSPRRETLNNEILEKVHRAVERMKPKYRDVFILRILQETPSEKVSQLLRIPVATVNTRTHRALKKLRQLILQEGLREEELFS